MKETPRGSYSRLLHLDVMVISVGSCHPLSNALPYFTGDSIRLYVILSCKFQWIHILLFLSLFLSLNRIMKKPLVIWQLNFWLKFFIFYENKCCNLETLFTTQRRKLNILIFRYSFAILNRKKAFLSPSVHF